MAIAEDTDVTTQMAANGVAVPASLSAVVTLVRPAIERALVNYLGWEVEQGTRTEYYPAQDRYPSEDREPLFYDSIAGRATPFFAGHGQNSIALKNIYVRSITSVHENLNAWNGASPPDFGASFLLTEGTDYKLDFGESGLSKSGLLFRQNSSWPLESRTVQVVYVSGFTATELGASGKWNHFKQAVILATIIRVNEIRQFAYSKQGGAGPVESKSLGDFSISFASEAIAELYGGNMTLPASVTTMLQTDISMAKYVG